MTMLNVIKARELLGETAEDMTGEQIEEIRDHVVILAENCIDSFLQKKKKERSVKNEQQKKQNPMR